MTTQSQPQTTPVERVRQINRTLDSLDDDMLDLLRNINDRAERYGWGDRHVAAGLGLIEQMKQEVKALEEERRQARAATRPIAS